MTRAGSGPGGPAAGLFPLPIFLPLFQSDLYLANAPLPRSRHSGGVCPEDDSSEWGVRRAMKEKEFMTIQGRGCCKGETSASEYVAG